MEDRQQAGRHSCLLLAIAPYIWIAIGQGQIFKGSDWSDNSELWIPIGSAQIEVGGSGATTSGFLKYIKWNTVSLAQKSTMLHYQ